MWEDMALPRDGGMVSEAFVERRCAELMRAYDGAVFFLCSPMTGNGSAPSPGPPKLRGGM